MCYHPLKSNVLCFGHCPSPLYSWWFVVYFSAVTNTVLCGIYPSTASLFHTCTLWMYVPGWSAVGLLLEGWLPAALALHLLRDQAEGLVVAILTQLVPPGQRDPHGSGRILQNWVRRKMQTGNVDLLSPHCLSCLHSVSQPQRRWAVIMTRTPVWQNLSGTLGSLRKRAGLKENWSTFKHSSEWECHESKNGPSNTARSKEGEEKGGGPFLSAYKPQVFSCFSLLHHLSAACLRYGFNGALSSIKQELSGVWDQLPVSGCHPRSKNQVHFITF